ncbi:MAG: glycine cleavage T C-terminal barrel domain-containing protein, partial [Nocardioidaceae bacterium]
TDCPLEAGLGFALALDKPGGFVGRDAVLARRSANAAAGGMGQRLTQIRVLDPDPLLHHAEVLHRDGEAVGYIRAASYGWTLGGAVGLAMVSGSGDPVTPDWLEAGTWEVDIAGIRHPVEVSLRPMYDPTSARIKV